MGEEHQCPWSSERGQCGCEMRLERARDYTMLDILSHSYAVGLYLENNKDLLIGL